MFFSLIVFLRLLANGDVIAIDIALKTQPRQGLCRFWK